MGEFVVRDGLPTQHGVVRLDVRRRRGVQRDQLVGRHRHHYMVPSPTLPMLMPLELIGVPQPVVNNLNSILQPIVNDGYSSLTPHAGPYFSEGALVGLPTAADVVTSLQRLFW